MTEDLVVDLERVLDAGPAPPVARARLLACVDALVAPGRLDGLAAHVASLFDVTVDKARMFLGWVDDASVWEPSPVPGILLAHLPPGPRWRAADCGLVRVPAGAAFPWHVHDGEETTLVLEGSARYSTGHHLHPGDTLVAGRGTLHQFTADPGRDLVFAVRHFGLRPA